MPLMWEWPASFFIFYDSTYFSGDAVYLAISLNTSFSHRKAGRSDVDAQYRKKVACIPSDILRRAFLQLSSRPEAFLTLRTHCIRTLATLSICQYILGIGDRHLSNFMVDLENGGMIGIDFGHNFGTATQVHVGSKMLGVDCAQFHSSTVKLE